MAIFFVLVHHFQMILEEPLSIAANPQKGIILLVALQQSTSFHSVSLLLTGKKQHQWVICTVNTQFQPIKNQIYRSKKHQFHPNFNCKCPFWPSTAISGAWRSWSAWPAWPACNRSPPAPANPVAATAWSRPIGRGGSRCRDGWDGGWWLGVPPMFGKLHDLRIDLERVVYPLCTRWVTPCSQ